MSLKYVFNYKMSIMIWFTCWWWWKSCWWWL